MDKKTILIILLILVVIVGASVILYGHFIHKEQVTTIKFGNTCSINITGEYETKNMTHGITQIQDKKGNTIIHFNSEGKGLSDITTFGAIKLPIVGETYDTGATPLETTINGTTKWVCYSSNNQTHDNILIIANSKEDAAKLHDSIKYNTANVNNPVDHVNNDTTSQQSKNQQANTQQSTTTNNQDNKEQTTYVGRDGKTHSMEEAYSVDYSSGDLNVINEQRRERGMTEISA